MRILVVATVALVLSACSHKQAPMGPGGYITMASGGSCTLTIVQPGNLPKVSIPATDCAFPTVGDQHAFVKQCGRIEFVPATELPSTKALVSTNARVLAQQFAACPLRVPYPPTVWQVK